MIRGVHFSITTRVVTQPYFTTKLLEIFFFMFWHQKSLKMVKLSLCHNKLLLGLIRYIYKKKISYGVLTKVFFIEIKENMYN